MTVYSTDDLLSLKRYANSPSFAVLQKCKQCINTEGVVADLCKDKPPRTWKRRSRGKCWSGKRRRRLKIMQMNVEGYRATFDGSSLKIDTTDVDVLVLSETFLTVKRIIPGFTTFDVPAVATEGRPKGGLLTAVKSSLSVSLLERTVHLLHVKLESVSTSIISCYFPPNTEVDIVVEDIIQATQHPRSGEVMIILGRCKLQDRRGKKREHLA